MKQKVNNQQGFVLITCLMMLVVLMIIGIAATNTTMIELQISGNDKIIRQSFYRADGVTREAMTHMFMDDLAEAPEWLLPIDNTILPATSTLAAERTAIHDDATWNRDDDGDSVPDNSLESEVFPETQMMVVHRGIAPGSSLDLGASRMHTFHIYGRSQQNNSESIIKTSFRKPYK